MNYLCIKLKELNIITNIFYHNFLSDVHILNHLYTDTKGRERWHMNREVLDKKCWPARSIDLIVFPTFSN